MMKQMPRINRTVNVKGFYLFLKSIALRTVLLSHSINIQGQMSTRLCMMRSFACIYIYIYLHLRAWK